MELRQSYIYLALTSLLMLTLSFGCADKEAALPAGAGGGGGGGVNSGTPEPGCLDNDGDGRGQGCSAGADCDDANMLVQDCDCGAANFAGCACEADTTESCFEGPEALIGVGVCRGGTRSCVDGAFTACAGQVAPTTEICNTIDDDCDGIVDEGAQLNACGNCDPTCNMVRDGEGGDWTLNEDNGEGLAINPEGGLELETQNTDFHFVYTANDGEGTVSKLSQETGEEVARYPSALQIGGGVPSNPENLNPSRTAVDLVGNVWVANKSFDRRGSVTKIAHTDCIDKNGNGTIETSSDLNGNGYIDIDSAEYVGLNDECVLFTVPLGETDGLPRALAIDPFGPVRGIGSVWVGLFNERRYFQLSGDDGSVLRVVDVGHEPYGAVMDGFGTLWSTTIREPQQGLVSIVSATGEASAPIAINPGMGCTDSYGVTIDGNNNVWVAGLDCSNASRYTPSTGAWATFDLGFNRPGQGRGIAADRDGWIYVGISKIGDDRAAQVARFRSEDGSQIQHYNLGEAGLDTVGVGLDSSGNLWAVNRRSDNAARINVNTGAIDVFPTGPGPYTYSDFTGYVLRNFTAPSGSYRTTYVGCPESNTAIWKNLDWEADVPVGAKVELRIRVADTIDDLVTATEYGPFETSPVDLEAAGVPYGRFARVEATLSTDTAGTTPVLWNLGASWTCPSVQ